MKNNCCERCVGWNCEDDIKRDLDMGKKITATNNLIWSCPCHRGLPLCGKCKEFACQCHRPKEPELDQAIREAEQDLKNGNTTTLEEFMKHQQEPEDWEKAWDKLNTEIMLAIGSHPRVGLEAIKNMKSLISNLLDKARQEGYKEGLKDKQL